MMSDRKFRISSSLCVVSFIAIYGRIRSDKLCIDLFLTSWSMYMMSKSGKDEIL